MYSSSFVLYDKISVFVCANICCFVSNLPCATFRAFPLVFLCGLLIWTWLADWDKICFSGSLADGALLFRDYFGLWICIMVSEQHIRSCCPVDNNNFSIQVVWDLMQNLPLCLVCCKILRTLLQDHWNDFVIISSLSCFLMIWRQRLNDPIAGICVVACEITVMVCWLFFDLLVISCIHL